MNKKRLIWIIVGIVGGIACLVVCAVGYVLYQFSTIGSQETKSAALVGKPAPDFNLSSLDQKTVRLSELRDKPVFLCFGTTWCPDCKAEAPLLQQLHEQNPDVRVIWVDSKEDTMKVTKFMQDEGLTFQTLVDPDGNVSQQYMIWAVPMIYVIDTNGVIRERFVEKLSQEAIDETLVTLGIESE